MHRYPLDTLPDHPLLSALSSAALERMQLNSERVELDAGESLFDAGEDAHRFYMVISGQLKLYQLSASGQEKVVELLSPGQTLAEAVMFMTWKKYPVYCEALSRAEVAAFNIAVYLEMLGDSPETTLRLLGDLSMRLRARLADIEALAFHNATLRVVGYLLSLVPADAWGAAEVELPFAKKDVAARLSLQPETLSRVFSRLREQGLLCMEGGVAHLPDVEGLRVLTWKH